MATRSVKISLDDHLLAEIDQNCETREVDRSDVVRKALLLYLAIDDAPESDVDLGGLLGG